MSHSCGFVLYLENQAEGTGAVFVFHSCLIKCGDNGCLEEVFDGRFRREDFGFISHAIPQPLENR